MKLETLAVTAVHDLLNDIPSVEIGSVDYRQSLGSAHHVDGRIDFRHGGLSYGLLIEAKSNGAPRFVRSGVHQLESYVACLRRPGEANGGPCPIPMLFSHYLSPESRAICTDHNVAYLDMYGNARLTFDTVHIERAVAGKPTSETRALRSIFSPKAAAILRILLRDPDRAWRVADLAAEADASYGHVSNVRKALLEREWLEIREDGVALSHPKDLLQTWRESYRCLAGQSIAGYTHLHGRPLDERLRGKLNPYPERPRAIYSMHSAAQWFAPFGRSGTQTLYADEAGAQMIGEELKLTPAERGANVVLHVPTDQGLFDDASEPVPGVFCTSPIVTYLDLWNGSDRDREAAEHLAGEFFQWLK